MAAVNLWELYRVGVIGDRAGYPFGGEGPVPYFYKTPELYSRVSAIFAGIWLCLSFLSIRNQGRWCFRYFSAQPGTLVLSLLFLRASGTQHRIDGASTGKLRCSGYGISIDLNQLPAEDNYIFPFATQN
jgi:hypothetical protein